MTRQEFTHIRNTDNFGNEYLVRMQFRKTPPQQNYSQPAVYIGFEIDNEGITNYKFALNDGETHEPIVKMIILPSNLISLSDGQIIIPANLPEEFFEFFRVRELDRDKNSSVDENQPRDVVDYLKNRNWPEYSKLTDEQERNLRICYQALRRNGLLI